MQNVPVGKYSCVKLLLEKSFHSSYSLVFNNSLNKFSKDKVHTQSQPSHFRMSLFCRFYFPWESIVHFMSHSLYQFSRSSEWLVKIRAASLVTSYEIWPMDVSIVSCFSPHGCKILLVQDHIIPVCVPEQWKMSKLFLQKYFKSNQMEPDFRTIRLISPHMPCAAPSTSSTSSTNNKKRFQANTTYQTYDMQKHKNTHTKKD